VPRSVEPISSGTLPERTVVSEAIVRCSRRGVGALSRLLAWIVGDLVGVRRDDVLRAMARAGVEDPRASARAMYRLLARHLLEVIGLVFSGRALEDVGVPGERLDALTRGGRGVVVATAHTGNWDLTACAVARERPVVVVTKRLSIGVLDRLWHWLRARRGVRLVVEGQVVRGALRALERGALVAMMIDQVPMRRRGVAWAPFLGARAPVDLGPALVAARAGVPLVVAFPFCDAAGRHRVHVADVLEPPRRAGRAWAEAAMTRATAQLDAFVRAHPEQWLWMHRRWMPWESRQRVTRAAADGTGARARAPRLPAGPESGIRAP
jgi:KDO2-lipid IV(A) lauroyltransferase